MKGRMTRTMIEPAHVREQLRGMAASPVFAKGGRILALLECLVEAEITGASHAINQRRIAIHVFNRDRRFDPRVDAIVRVEMGRLRNKLLEYYATDGRADRVLLEVRRGEYRCRIRQRDLPTDLAATLIDFGGERAAAGDRWAFMSGPEQPPTLTELAVVMTRVFRTPRERVFEAWTNPEHMREWYQVPDWPLVTCEIDLRVGGEWRLVTRRCDGTEVIQRGVYREVMPPARIVYTEVWEGRSADEMLVSIRFAEREPGTTTMAMEMQRRT